jgi:hypothetical protein
MSSILGGNRRGIKSAIGGVWCIQRRCFGCASVLPPELFIAAAEAHLPHKHPHLWDRVTFPNPRPHPTVTWSARKPATTGKNGLSQREKDRGRPSVPTILIRPRHHRAF